MGHDKGKGKSKGREKRMPIVDTSDPDVYRLNYVTEANRLWYNHGLNQQIPVGAKKLRINYIRSARLIRAKQYANALVRVLGLSNGMTIALPGAGFGWLEEEMQVLLPTAKFASFDTGVFVQSRKGLDETAELDANLDTDGITDPTERATWHSRLITGTRSKVIVDDEDLQTGNSRRAILTRLELSGRDLADWSISEQVLPWLDDADCLSFSESQHLIANNVAHLLTPFLPSKASEQEKNPWNWKHQDSLAPTTALLEALPWYTTTSWKDLLPNDLIVAPSFHYRTV